MTDRRYDLTRLKRTVGIGQVLAHYGLDSGLRPYREERVGPCPLPGHGGDRSNRAAFRVHLSQGLWHCMTHCGGGDIVALLAQMEGGDYAACARVLAMIEATRPAQGMDCNRPAAARPAFTAYTRRLRLDPDHPLLRQRGILPETAQAFETGGWPLAGFLEGCVGVRLHDWAGNPLGYAGRRADPAEARRFGKWKLPPGLARSALLFNYHRLTAHEHAPVVIVEGPFDAMRVWQAGHRAVVALLGTFLSEAQRALLASAPRLLALLDGDEAGGEGARRIANAFPLGRVRLVPLAAGRDPADLSETALRECLEPYVGSEQRLR